MPDENPPSSDADASPAELVARWTEDHAELPDESGRPRRRPVDARGHLGERLGRILSGDDS